MAEFTLHIDGMHCGACVRRVSQALASEGLDVKEVRVGAARIASDQDPRRWIAHWRSFRRPATAPISIPLPGGVTGWPNLPQIGDSSRIGHDLRGMPAPCRRSATLHRGRGVGAGGSDGASRQRGVRSGARPSRTLVQAIRGAGYDAVLPRGGASARHSTSRLPRCALRGSRQEPCWARARSPCCWPCRWVQIWVPSIMP